MELAEFLLARIAEDEELAREALARASVYGDREVSWKWLRSTGGSTMWEPTSHDPARVLAECAAKRRIVALADAAFPPDVDPVVEHHAGNDGPWVGSVTLKLLALPYADHLDYRPEWRP